MSRARLIIFDESGSISKEFEIDQANVIIGRAPQSNLVIDDSDISRSHAQIVKTQNGFFVSDMGSTNGTFLNGAVIKAKQMFELRSNDQVNLGKVALMFQIVSDSFPQPEQNKELDYTYEDGFQNNPSNANPYGYSDEYSQPGISSTQEFGNQLNQAAYSPQGSANEDYNYPQQSSNQAPEHPPEKPREQHRVSSFLDQEAQASTHPYLAQQGSYDQQPQYIPPAPSSVQASASLPLNQFDPEVLSKAMFSGDLSNASSAPSLSAEELGLADEIFGSSKKAEKSNLQKSAFSLNIKSGLFQSSSPKKSAAAVPTAQDFSEEELFNQVFSSGPSISVEVTKPTNTQGFTPNQAFEEPLPVLSSESNSGKYLASTQLYPTPIPADQEAFYYPTVSPESANIFPKGNYSYTQESASEDPFKALSYSEDDSLFNKFTQGSEPKLSLAELKEKLKRETHHVQQPTPWAKILKNYALPIGIVAVVVVICIVLYVRKSGLFG